MEPDSVGAEGSGQEHVGEGAAGAGDEAPEPPAWRLRSTGLLSWPGRVGQRGEEGSKEEVGEVGADAGEW